MSIAWHAPLAFGQANFTKSYFPVISLGIFGTIQIRKIWPLIYSHSLSNGMRLTGKLSKVRPRALPSLFKSVSPPKAKNNQRWIFEGFVKSCQRLVQPSKWTYFFALSRHHDFLEKLATGIGFLSSSFFYPSAETFLFQGEIRTKQAAVDIPATQNISLFFTNGETHF